ncbi:MAG TPA: hypothetical protein VMV86_02870 [Methanosarcinales archaeon]|jgi:hypothetical protein|nr:hypothetical protein [Methanosarcinales archaeon]|tara:strand:- start:255 stop:572 length:318 start_codon:yes stop_codon:yes gene_type:complete
MTVFYQTNSWSSQPQLVRQTKDLWTHLSKKSNWRIVQLANGFYQTEHKEINCGCDPKTDTCCDKWLDVTRRETLEGAEQAIDSSVEHYAKRLEFLNGPKVVKTFK